MSEYQTLVSDSAELLARHHLITDQLANKVRNEFGVDLTKEELSELTSVRLAVLSGDESLLATFDQEIQSHPGVQQAIKVKELAAAFSDHDHANHKQVQEDWDRLSIHQRMAKAREMDAAKPKAETKPALTEAQRSKAISDISNLRGGAKIAAARAAGLS